MKVCTDACLFGAWMADRIKNEKLIISNVLDVGCGTGLLSLMLAQKLPDAIIDAVEIDEAAAKQARENFNASKWKERLNVYHSSIQNFASIATTKYDVIIANPPFYENDLKSSNAKRNLALHSSDLKLEELISIADKLLNEDGSFFVLLPHQRIEYFDELIEGKFFMQEKILVKQSEKHKWFRGLVWIRKKSGQAIQLTIIIMNESNEYTPEFVNLLKYYYLNL